MEKKKKLVISEANKILGESNPLKKIKFKQTKMLRIKRHSFTAENSMKVQ